MSIWGEHFPNNSKLYRFKTLLRKGYEYNTMNQFIKNDTDNNGNAINPSCIRNFMI
ncbi:hypothetical protein SPHINGO8BC_50696 [Sphingobacterium multivorum]|uniref:Uncharacterized protein n=1 Tax=Sphingobacterium multivorum TaxID=28454 RepID=A0A654CD62_SPHMU|nr:hypothetical protein SPHINGO8BC_50696 [Sphingobacterium multivorum]